MIFLRLVQCYAELSPAFFDRYVMDTGGDLGDLSGTLRRLLGFSNGAMHVKGWANHKAPTAKVEPF